MPKRKRNPKSKGKRKAKFQRVRVARANRHCLVGRPPGAMTTRTGQERGLEVSLGVALKTWARKSLLMLYQDRFPNHHPNHTPHSVLMNKSAARFRLKQNKPQAEAIEKNEVGKFDISALHLLLRYACGFSSGSSRWNDTKTLEGNIEKLKDLRNLEAHWTEEVYAKENLEEKWKELLDAVMFILKNGGFEKWIPIFEINLQSIREGETYHEDRELLQKSLQGELRKLYKSGRKTTLMPLVWAGRSFHFTHDALHAYISTKFSITQDRCRVLEEENASLRALACLRTPTTLVRESNETDLFLLVAEAEAEAEEGSRSRSGRKEEEVEEGKLTLNQKRKKRE